MPRLLLTTLVAAALAGTLGSAAETVPGRAIRVIDGDTVDLPSGERLRLLGIDTPELRGARCPAEHAAAVTARARLVALLGAGPVTVTRGDRDRYGRTLATLATPAGDVGARLVAEGLALIWQPGSVAYEARRKHWCGGER